MILMVSGRTDIINYYNEWFINRLKNGFVDVRNPINPNLVSRIFFSDVDLIVICTKNPLPIIPYLKNIKIPILMQVTLTSYKNDIEVNVINKKLIIEGIKEIRKIIGKDNIYIRYDPILLNDRYDIDYHIKAFKKLTDLLKDNINYYIISFIDIYKNVKKHLNELKLKEIKIEDKIKIVENFSYFAHQNNSKIISCAEDEILLNYGLDKGECISANEVYRLTGKIDFKVQNIRNKACRCLSTVDIGFYNSCLNFCKYCYANFKGEDIIKNNKSHNKYSSLLIGDLKDTDIIKVRRK